MPEPVKISDMPITQEHPAEDALKLFQSTDEFTALTYGSSMDRAINCGFLQGWKAALEWLPFRIQQFRELEEGLRKEIEALKEEIAGREK